MYYPDLSSCPHEVILSREDFPTLCVGWLAHMHPYSQGEVPDEFVERLWVLCSKSILYTLGFHKCPFCRRPSYGTLAQHGNDELRLGSAEIRVLGKDVVYAAPNLIYHYVVEHHYCPPEEFIQAVIEGALPGSPEYETLRKKRGWR